MKGRLGTAAFALILLLGGCAALPGRSSPAELEAQIDRWVSEDEYGRALEALAQLPADSPDYQRLAARRPEIQQRANRFARESVIRAEALVQADSWHEAWELYQQALSRLPGNPTLDEGYQRFRERQQHELGRIDTELLLARGEHLRRTLPLLLARADVAAYDRSAQGDLERARDEARETGAELRNRGQTAMDAGELSVARRALPLAARLDESRENRRAHAQLEHRIAARTKAKVKRKSAQESARRQAEVTETLSAFESAYEHGELLQAQRLMARLKQLDAGNPRIQALDKGLEQRVDTSVEGHLQAGTSLYSRGQFEEAQSEWRKALDLDPENAQAKANLDRADRVLGKLQELRRRQGP